MFRWATIVRYGVFLLVLAGEIAWAATPDPVEFGWAVENNQIERVRKWLNEGLDPEFQGNEIGTGLMIAAWNRLMAGGIGAS